MYRCVDGRARGREGRYGDLPLRRIGGWTPRRGANRLVAVLGGTTTAADCLVALRHLVGLRPLVKGAAIARYERAFAHHVGARHACSFSSGRVGLYGLLRALGIGPGDEVLLQVPTHIVVPNAIRYTGARPVYVDCTLDSYNMDLEQAEQRVTPETKALLLQHTFGIPADLDAALALVQKHGLVLIEDCVHALGSTYDGRPVGGFGRAAFYSTEETKTISTTMGGMVTTSDLHLAARMREFQETCAWPSAAMTARYLVKLLVYHVLTEPHLHCYVRPVYDFFGGRHPLPRATDPGEMQGKRPAGYEQRLSNAQAALGLSQLRGLRRNLAHRRKLGAQYSALLSERGLRTPKQPPKADAAMLRYPVWVRNREAARRLAAPHAILGTWFTSVLEEAALPEHGEYQPGSCPNAEAAAAHLVNLPTHPRTTTRDAQRIVEALAGASDGACVIAPASLGEPAVVPNRMVDRA